MQTRLLILHNDQDGAVPWYQGIELYIGMRRLDKEAYLFKLQQRAARHLRPCQPERLGHAHAAVFDTTLKRTPPSDWMINGISAKDKGKDVLRKVST